MRGDDAKVGFDAGGNEGGGEGDLIVPAFGVAAGQGEVEIHGLDCGG